MCTTTAHHETHISNECSRGGSAICDGFCEWHGVECTCVCHRDEDAPQTVVGMVEYHDEMWNVAARFEHCHTPTLIKMVTDEKYRLMGVHNDVWKGVQGAQFRTFASTDGHGYVYVEFS